MAAFHDHFSGVAANYASYRPRYPEALFDFLRTLVPETADVWDCACGNGQASLDLAERFGHVTATDASVPQIASAPVHPRVEFRVAPAEASGLPDASVQLVTVAQAVHWFAGEPFYSEAKRVLAPGGVIAVWAYDLNRVEGAEVNAVAHHFYHEIVGPYWPPERKLVEAHYRTLPFPFPELPAPALEMTTDWTLDQLLGYHSTWSAVNRYVSAQGTNPLPAFREALAAVWGDPDQPRRITWPIALKVGRTAN